MDSATHTHTHTQGMAMGWTLLRDVWTGCGTQSSGTGPALTSTADSCSTSAFAGSGSHCSPRLRLPYRSDACSARVVSPPCGACALSHYGGTNPATRSFDAFSARKGKGGPQNASHPEVGSRKWGWTGYPQGWGSGGPGGGGKKKVEDPGC